LPAFLLSNSTAVLKEVILPYVQDNFPKQTITLNLFKRNAGVTTINNAFHAAVRTSRHGGVTNLANDGNTLNATAGVTFGRGSVSVKSVTGAFNISKLAIDASQGDRRSIVNTFTEQAKTLVSDFARDINRQLYMDATGIIGQVAGSTNGTVFTVDDLDSSNLDDGRSIDWYGSLNRDILPEEYIFANMRLGIGTAAVGQGTVLSVSGSSITTTAAGTAAYVDNDAIYQIDGSGEGAGSSMLNGIHEVLDSRTGTNLYAGRARSETGWTPQFGSIKEALTLSRMEGAYLAARKYAREGDKYAIFVNKTLYQRYGDLLTAMRRTVNSTELMGGWTGLEFAAGAGNVAVYLDYQVPDGECVGLDLDTWTLCQVSDMNWLEEGAEALLRLQNTITYQAVMVWFLNVMCLAPAANFKEVQKTA